MCGRDISFLHAASAVRELYYRYSYIYIELTKKEQLRRQKRAEASGQGRAGKQAGRCRQSGWTNGGRYTVYV